MGSEYVYPALPKDRLGQCWGGAQPSSLSYYRYICLGLAGNLGIVSGPRNLFQELHAINGVQSSEQPALGKKNPEG